MAASSPRKKLQDEATCSICLDFFTEPVIIDCGHNFCRACIAQYFAGASICTACPYCREIVQPGSLKSNRHLANFIEIAKQLCNQAKQGAGEGEVCERHQEPLKLFCRSDEVPICVVCDRSKEHRGHNVVPVEEAAQEYKDGISSHLEILKKEREGILACKAATEKESQDLLKHTETEKQKAVAKFRQLHQFLEEQEKLLLAQMEVAEKEIAARRDEQLAKLSGELSSLQAMIQEMEEKCQQPATELLQDVRCILQRCKKNPVAFENPVVFPVVLKWKIWEFLDINPFLEGIMKQFKDSLVSGLQLQKANLTLDPNTANPRLILSQDLKSVRWKDEYQHLPNNPERFNQRCFVLGCVEFEAGRHFWEVSVESGEGWSVGVAKKSVRRKGQVTLSRKEGIWDLGKWENKYWVSNNPCSTLLPMCAEPKRIRVSLNCAGGRLTFFDADTAALLYTVSGAPFSRETLLPFFWVYGKTHLKLSS